MSSYIGQSRRPVLTTLGVSALVLAIALPFVGWFGGDAYVQHAMITDPVPQGAMLFAGLGWLASIAAAVVFGVTGMIFLWFSRSGNRPST